LIGLFFIRQVSGFPVEGSDETELAEDKFGRHVTISGRYADYYRVFYIFVN